MKKKTYKLFYYWLVHLNFCFYNYRWWFNKTNDSGLSITEWELFKGIIPPMNEKHGICILINTKIPQFELLNFNMTIEEFKFISYWEYFHRIFARIIGLFLIPLIYFYLLYKQNI